MKNLKFVLSSFILLATFISFNSFVLKINTTTPTVSLNGKIKGNILASKFINSKEFLVKSKDDKECNIHSYTLYHTSIEKDPVEYKGKDGAFKGIIQHAIKKASKGDEYIFVDVNVKCQNEKPKKVNKLHFKIK